MKLFMAPSALLHPDRDGNVLAPAANLCARVIFEPVPKTEKGIAGLQQTIAPSLNKNFGVSKDVESGMAVMIAEEGGLAGMCGAESTK